MKAFDNFAAAENYAENSSKKHDTDRYVAKANVIKSGIKYYVYESASDIDHGEKLLSHFKSGERQ